jgi:hypothetical protein
MAGVTQELKFAFENLDFLFAVLAALGVGMTLLVVPLSVVCASWGVARASERSSFVATLDPRLAPGFWTYLNNSLIFRLRHCERCQQRLRMCLLLPVHPADSVNDVFDHWGEYCQQVGRAGNRL